MYIQRTTGEEEGALLLVPPCSVWLVSDSSQVTLTSCVTLREGLVDGEVPDGTWGNEPWSFIHRVVKGRIS